MLVAIMADSPCYKVIAPVELSYFTASVSGIFSLITICGNLAVCLAVYKDPFHNLRTPFMYFLVNLSLSDLVVGCITMPTSVATHTMEAIGTKKKVHVQLILITYFISATASLLSLAALCVDRYFAVANPLMYRRNMKFKRCILGSVVIWVVSLGLPMLYFVTGYIPYLMIFAHTGVVVALAILVFTYFKIYKSLKQQATKFRSKQGDAKSEENDTKQTHRGEDRKSASRKTERRVTRVFIIILAVFAACYLPVIVMIYLLQFCPNCDCTFRHVLRDLQFLLAVSNSAINPFVCTIRLKPFRAALEKILGIRKPGEAYAVTTSSGQQPTSAVLSNQYVSECNEIS